MVARVKVKSADGRSRFFEIPENAVLTIGRSDAADIVLDDMTVSRRHAVVGAAENGCFIEDNSSTSGTWINGERISGRRTVSPSDNIKIGGFELSVSAGAQAAARRRLRRGEECRFTTPRRKLKCIPTKCLSLRGLSNRACSRYSI